MAGKKADTGFEIPEQMREFADKSMDQARKAFDSFMSATQKAVTSVEGSTNAVQAGTMDVGRMAIDYAETNVNAAFAFAQKLVHAKDPQEFLALQQEFIQKQLATYTEQTKSIGESVAKAAGEIAKTAKP
ncbi:MAG: phasin [Hyphomicrobiales bacterium]